MTQEPVDAGNPDVEEPDGAAAKLLQRHRGLFGDRQIRGAASHHDDKTSHATRSGRWRIGETRKRMIAQPRQAGANRLI